MNHLLDAGEDFILAAFANHPHLLQRNLHSVTADMFREHNRPLFRELVDTVVAGDKPDLITTTAKLRQSGELEAIGGAYRMSEIWTTVPSPEQLPHWVGLLRQNYEAKKRLETLETARQTLETALVAGTDIREAFAAVDTMLADAGKIPGKPLASKTMGQLAADVVDELQARLQHGGAIPGIKTGFPTMDKHTLGMQPGKVWVISGRPGDGKSVMMQNLVEAALDQGKRVRIYPLEMSQQEQAMRVLCSQGQLDNAKIGWGAMSPGEMAAMAHAVKRMKAMQADIVDTDGATASDILADIEQSDADVVMVDYLQLMEDTGRKGATREEIIAGISRRLKRTAKKAGKMVLTASQLNDNGQLRESRAIGQDADALFQIEKREAKDEHGEAVDNQRTLHCLKLRGGKRFWTLPMLFLGHVYQFRELDEKN